MKQPIHYFFIILIICIAVSCKDSSEAVPSLAYTTNAVERIGIVTEEYEEEYGISLKIYNDADVKIESVLVYKHYEGILGESEKLLVRTTNLDVRLENPYEIYFNFTADEFKDNLIINNTLFPENYRELSIEDVFVLSYELHYEDNTILEASEKTIIEFVPRLEGWFVAEDTWSNIFTQSSYFDGLNVRIRAVNPGAYIIESVGPFDIEDDSDNWVYFYIDEEELVHIPIEYEGEIQTAWGEDPIYSPEYHPEYFNSNEVNQVYYDEGVYRVRLNLGYYRESGLREFWQVLKKLD